MLLASVSRNNRARRNAFERNVKRLVRTNAFNFLSIFVNETQTVKSVEDVVDLQRTTLVVL